MTTTTTIIGIDAATKSKKTGLVCAAATEESIEIENVWQRTFTFEEQIHNWVEQAPGRVLLAVDTPMGYPKDFGAAVVNHQAGRKFDTERIPKRYTDKEIRRAKYGKVFPFDIAADKIGATTFATLNNPEIQKFDLIWDKDFGKYGMIEVYPQATLAANCIREKYKGNTDTAKKNREEIFNKLKELYLFKCNACPKDEHDFDALICCLAGVDFIRGNSFCYPSDMEDIVKKEGWIWVLDKGSDKE